jgi:signal transduction histidine kinase
VRRILVVDDNPQDRRFARRGLEQEFSDAEISEASDESGLRAALQSGPFTAVVTDFRLRWVDGLQVLTEVKHRYPTLPVVMFTDSGSEEVAAEGFRQGLSDYILKGAGQYARLAHGVRRAIERARAEEAERDLLAREHEARVLAEEANRIKDRFLATLSHELRTPLNAITGWLQMLSVRPADPAHAQRCIERAGHNARLLTRIIDDLTDVSRIAAGKLSIHPQRIRLDDVARAAIESVDARARHKSIEIDFRHDGADTTVLGDADRLEQVAANLLSNAVKFTPEGGHVVVTLTADEQDVRLTVRDTGRGIARAFAERMFERFAQEDDGPTRSHSGLGLGLALVHDLVELHGGTVTGHSAGENQGATFVVSLPAIGAHSPGVNLFEPQET